MIVFNYETNFKLKDESKIINWIDEVVEKHEHSLGEINYIFCDDAYLHKLNVEFLKHDTLTDIISFDYTMGKLISGDIFISIERVEENSKKFNQSIDNELNRVIIHGVLHYLGLNDKSDKEKKEMRAEEDACLTILK